MIVDERSFGVEFSKEQSPDDQLVRPSVSLTPTDFGLIEQVVTELEMHLTAALNLHGPFEKNK